jgi:beta-fructofuranosidase
MRRCKYRPRTVYYFSLLAMYVNNGTNTGDYAHPNCRAAAGDTIPFMIDNTYHLFQLGSPPNTVHHPARVRCSWVRQKSQDLINWTRDSDYVLSPGSVTTDFDRDGCWTGSAVNGPNGNMHTFYTGYNLAENGKQVSLHARSSDLEGSKFIKPDAPISLDALSSLQRYEATDFRDPYVFYNDNENVYWMLVAIRFSKGPY